MLIILDRDGVINIDSHEYIKSPDEWIALPGSLEAIAKLHQAGHTIMVATNQSGLARGFYDHDTLEAIHEKMCGLVEANGGKITDIFFCPHHPEENCVCRKPLPGLLTQLADKYQADLSQALMIGDSMRDVQAAQAVGCSAALVRTGNGETAVTRGLGLENVQVYRDLADCVRQILAE